MYPILHSPLSVEHILIDANYNIIIFNLFLQLERHYFDLNWKHSCPSELPMVETLALTGKAMEGDKLTAVEVIPKSQTQQYVWSKYKKDVRYQWYCPCLT